MKIEIYEQELVKNELYHTDIFIDDFLVWSQRTHPASDGAWYVTPMTIIRTKNFNPEPRINDGFTLVISIYHPAEVVSLKSLIGLTQQHGRLSVYPSKRLLSSLRPISLKVWYKPK